MFIKVAANIRFIIGIIGSKNLLGGFLMGGIIALIAWALTGYKISSKDTNRKNINSNEYLQTGVEAKDFDDRKPLLNQQDIKPERAQMPVFEFADGIKL